MVDRDSNSAILVMLIFFNNTMILLVLNFLNLQNV